MQNAAWWQDLRMLGKAAVSNSERLFVFKNTALTALGMGKEHVNAGLDQVYNTCLLVYQTQTAIPLAIAALEL
jgi:hypothetical protein